MSASAGDYDYCATLLYEADRDAWLASLFLPEAARRHVRALNAFAQEIERIPALISEPRLGEIRLQWWLETVRGERAGEAALNPVSAALLDTVAKFNLPQSALESLVEAHRFDLYNDPMPSLHDLEGYCGETQGALFRLATLVLSGGQENASGEASGHAGVALGIAGVLAHLGAQAARGQCFLPKDVLARHGALPEAAAAGLNSPAMENALAELRARAQFHLDEANARVAALPAGLKPAFVRLAIVPLMLRALERRRTDPFGPPVEIPQWRKQWAMWRWRV